MKNFEKRLMQAAKVTAQLAKLDNDMRAFVCISTLEEMEAEVEARHKTEHPVTGSRRVRRRPNLKVLDGGAGEVAKPKRKYSVTPKVIAGRKRAAAKRAKRAKAGS